MSGIGNDVDGVKNTFSSWDNCMSEDYCKYPVIAAIVIVSLIVLSVLFCFVRCCCCGMECCCGCLSCCNACCPSPRNNRRDKLDTLPGPYNRGSTAYNNNTGYQPTMPPSYNSPAQFARFDASKPVNGDSLPAMPTWGAATSHKVLDESHDVEMDHMTPQDEQKAPMLAHQPPSPLHDADGFGAAALGAGAAGAYADPENPDALPQHAQYYGAGSSGNLGEHYSRQDQTDPLQRYGGAGAIAQQQQQQQRLSTGSPYGRQPSYQGNYSPQPPQPSHSGGPSPMGAGAMQPQQQLRALSPPAHTPSPPSAGGYAPPQQPYGGGSGSALPHSLSPGSPGTPVSSQASGGSALPGALQAGKNNPAPLQVQTQGGGYQAYSAYSPTSQQQQQQQQGGGYQAYAPRQNNGW